jgi:hypothetical protein
MPSRNNPGGEFIAPFPKFPKDFGEIIYIAGVIV